MGDFRFLLLLGLGALVAFGPAVLIYFAMDERERGRPITSRRLARIAMWIALAVYAVLATVAATDAFRGPPGPPLKRLLSALARMPDGAQAILVLSGMTVFGAWWSLRDERRPTDPEPANEEMR